MTEALEPPPDAELIKAVRAGDVSAFGVLYERHLVAATRAAGCLASTRAEREDLVAEAFTRVLRVLREGRGPNEEFRPYLLVAMRNIAISGASRGVPVSLYADVPDVSPAGGADGRVIDRWDASAAAEAFASLPERWRVVLWHTEVENEPPASVAQLLGMRPNSVAALAYRAREGLRQAYLRMHAPEPPRRECRSTVDKLAGYVRRNVPLPLSRKIGKHLHDCPDCRARADTLGKINSELRGLLGPIVLGAPLAAAYLPAPAVTGAVSGALGASMASGTALAVASEVAVVDRVRGARDEGHPGAGRRRPGGHHHDGHGGDVHVVRSRDAAPRRVAGRGTVVAGRDAEHRDAQGPAFPLCRTAFRRAVDRAGRPREAGRSRQRPRRSRPSPRRRRRKPRRTRRTRARRRPRRTGRSRRGADVVTCRARPSRPAFVGGAWY